jgi:hypothetical protein
MSEIGTEPQSPTPAIESPPAAVAEALGAVKERDRAAREEREMERRLEEQQRIALGTARLESARAMLRMRMTLEIGRDLTDQFNLDTTPASIGGQRSDFTVRLVAPGLAPIDVPFVTRANATWIGQVRPALSVWGLAMADDGTLQCSHFWQECDTFGEAIDRARHLYLSAMGQNGDRGGVKEEDIPF